jgi:hypothetical protein
MSLRLRLEENDAFGLLPTCGERGRTIRAHPWFDTSPAEILREIAHFFVASFSRAGIIPAVPFARVPGRFLSAGLYV